MIVINPFFIRERIKGYCSQISVNSTIEELMHQKHGKNVFTQKAGIRTL